MKILTLATIIALSSGGAAFAQSVATPPNPNNCSPAFPNCASSINGNNKTPGNTPGTYRNGLKQEERAPQTATEPEPMNTYGCPAGQTNCVPHAGGSNAASSSGATR